MVHRRLQIFINRKIYIPPALHFLYYFIRFDATDLERKMAEALEEKYEKVLGLLLVQLRDGDTAYRDLTGEMKEYLSFLFRFIKRFLYPSFFNCVHQILFYANPAPFPLHINFI